MSCHQASNSRCTIDIEKAAESRSSERVEALSPGRRAIAFESELRTAYDCVMTVDAQKLLEEALTLPPSDRAELAAQLLASLDEAEGGVEAAWAAEIAHSIGRPRAGETVVVAAASGPDGSMVAQLAKLHGASQVDEALRTAADAGRFADGDLAAILAHHGAEVIAFPARASEQQSLQRSTRSWEGFGG